ncbi:ABC transporter [Virgibacillus indicus]|uniref:ABC transporter n=1 Tax=Virgibacillus indicus TaxID=2024554 RepID=A0A265N5X2_9BACI|nr:Vga family ABC-F type ribosomal protection protein [Virgibacillus indicus]OZU87423.1 ABC transporter [Virgibacillus indicus]
MILLEASHLKVYVKDRLLIDVEKLQIQEKDRIGLVGVNGSGKTTLLEILAGKKQPGDGTIKSDATLELLPQLKNTNTTKSGGEVTQTYINRSLATKADILFADEPTTNLDTAHIEKLEKQLLRRQGAIVIVSHDRAFLDSQCKTIWELHEGKLREYKGNYSDYVSQKELEIKQQENAYDQYIKKKKQLESALELKEQKAQRATKKPKNVSSSEAKITGAKPYFANKQKKLRKAGKAIETRIEKLEEVEKVKETAPIKMNLPNEEAFKSRIVLRAEDIIGMAGDRILWNKASFHIKGGDKLAILGNNGSGKTTLLKKIVNCDTGISISPAMKIGYFSQNLDVLNKEQSILENVSSTSSQSETLIRIVLARLHFLRDDVYKKVDVLSGGERVKVAFAKLFVSDMNTLILDEPTNFLDIEAVEALEKLLADYEGTILLVSHDRRFIQAIADRILEIKDKQLTLFDGTYEAFKQYIPKQETDSTEQELLVVETRISEVLSKLSIEPSETLEAEFQSLLKRKKEIEEL